ncbi:2-methoxy-6-polyprenyl-1,4-benzoquinol methylase, mitochondrial isoform X3 [Juglans microcarpa x Juglans regia]|uniref:2-methoxy-6-polyprenyl-1,4-benzoquinol methylase, mitochondrial isoform X3 n=1 Tax=Juglans microcarpa x Juglans regia TaxID=2249226 RepID=UPI001B7E0279|nr:2-methoxy-6-polyprenyl-1,4-benzoquinol methylase, mitochondrial isoform X3 [Juglans microcarpa x Juglans regia]
MALRMVTGKFRSKLFPMFSSSLLHSHATSFGFKEVHEEEKSRMVGNVFSNVASNYDLMNDLMSAGLHRLWKDRLVSKLNPFPGMKHLDVAGGTGSGEEKSLIWVEGNAEALTFEDNSMDGYTIAFGIRNVTHIEKVLAEAFRVLKRGGRFLCLELSHVEVPIFKEFYDYYSFSIIPALGELVAGDRDSYQYLVESVRRFPPQETFASMIADAGFQKVEYENLVGGVVSIHSGLKL